MCFIFHQVVTDKRSFHDTIVVCLGNTTVFFKDFESVLDLGWRSDIFEGILFFYLSLFDHFFDTNVFLKLFVEDDVLRVALGFDGPAGELVDEIFFEVLISFFFLFG